MARSLPRGRGRVVRRGGPRRKVELARSSQGQSGLGVSPLLSDLLADWLADAGLLRIPPGVTIGGMKYRLTVGGATAAITTPLTVTWGIGVFPDTIDDVDLDPNTSRHIDWLEWGSFSSTFLAAESKQLNGNGDDGFRTVRSKRRVDGIEQQLLLSIKASSAPAGLSFNVMSSTALLLP